MSVRQEHSAAMRFRGTPVRAAWPSRLRSLVAIACSAGACIAALTSPCAAQGTGQSSATAKQRAAAKAEARRFDELVDTLFHDMGNIVQLGMDFPTGYKERMEKNFLRWATGHPLTEDQNDYLPALETLNKSWKLLLKSGTVFHEMRERQTDDDTTRKLREESRQLYTEGVKLWKEAVKLRKAADESRDAKRRAAQEAIDRENIARWDAHNAETRRITGEIQRLRDAQEAEDGRHELTTANITVGPYSDAARRKALRAEQSRHDQRTKAIKQQMDRLTDQLVKKAIADSIDYPSNGSTTSDEREALVGVWNVLNEPIDNGVRPADKRLRFQPYPFIVEDPQALILIGRDYK